MSKKLNKEEWFKLLDDANALDRYLKEKKKREPLSPEDLERWFEEIDLIDESDLDPERDRKRWPEDN